MGLIFGLSIFASRNLSTNFPIELDSMAKPRSFLLVNLQELSNGTPGVFVNLGVKNIVIVLQFNSTLWPNERTRNSSKAVLVSWEQYVPVTNMF